MSKRMKEGVLTALALFGLGAMLALWALGMVWATQDERKSCEDAGGWYSMPGLFGGGGSCSFPTEVQP